MAALAGGAFLAALGVAVIPAAFWAGMAMSVLAYALIGLGAGASGTRAAGAFGHRNRAATARGGGDDHLADDDLRHRRHRRNCRLADGTYSPRLLLEIVGAWALAPCC